MMRRHSLLLLGLALLLAACPSSDEGGIPTGSRLITGRAYMDGVSSASTRRALQVVAVYASADCGQALEVGVAGEGLKSCALFGAPFDPGNQGSGVPSAPFQLLVPCSTAVNLLVQVESTSGGQAPGELLARLVFADGLGGQTSLIAAEPAGCRDTPELATNLLDLGTFLVPADPPAAGPTDVVLGGTEGGANPLATVDSGGEEGVANLADGDDDGDGTLDAADTDSDGDGLQDAAQIYQPAWL
jgi:hypothetical protein